MEVTSSSPERSWLAAELDDEDADACSVVSGGDRSGPEGGTHFGVLASAVAECPLAVVLVDAHLSILFTSPSAQRHLARGDGLAVSGGRLRLVADLGAERRIRQALGGSSDAASTIGIPFHSLRPSGRRPYEILLRIPTLAHQPWSTAGASAAVLGLLYFRDPDEGVAISVPALRQRFGLTVSEARTTLAIVTGGGLAAACRALGLRPMTVRAYLRQVFDKTGAHCQADLVRLVFTGALALPIELDDGASLSDPSKRAG
jgi:DNA-binding CsgD family transcriptional regulator